MRREESHQRILAMTLTALAGYVDAVGYFQLGGFFVSFMSGNSTRLAVGIVSNTHAALLALGLIASFVGGAMIGTLAGHGVRRAYRSSAVLGLVAILLAVAGGLAVAGHEAVAIFAMTLAMGGENAVFERDRAMGTGVTFMTWTLVSLGKRLAGILIGEDRWAWVADLLLWASLVAGAVLGAAAFSAAGLEALWGAASVAAALAVLTAFLGPVRAADFTA